VRLPSPAPRAPRAAKRKLFDDGKSLPRCPSCPALSSKSRVVRAADCDQTEHLHWNRLISDCTRSKRSLVGTQLRYLIWPVRRLSGLRFWSGLLLSVLPGLLDRLGCTGLHRIGSGHWFVPVSHSARVALRQSGQSCYRLVLHQVRDDWMERYGVRPVLVETYVDRRRTREVPRRANCGASAEPGPWPHDGSKAARPKVSKMFGSGNGRIRPGRSCKRGPCGGGAPFDFLPQPAALGRRGTRRLGFGHVTLEAASPGCCRTLGPSGLELLYQFWWRRGQQGRYAFIENPGGTAVFQPAGTAHHNTAGAWRPKRWFCWRRHDAPQL